jgi:hypothetical protein
VAVVDGTGGEQHQREQSGERPAHAPADAPGDEQPDQSHGRADQPARLEQRERQHLGRERCHEVEAAAVIVEVHPRQRALIAQARGIEVEQQCAVFGMRVVVPA